MVLFSSVIFGFSLCISIQTSFNNNSSYRLFVFCLLLLGQFKQDLLFSFNIFAVLPVIFLVIANIFVLIQSGGEAFAYNSNVRGKALFIPLEVFILSYLPVFFYSLYAVYYENDKNKKFLKGSLLIVSLMFIFNHLFGYNNHPYRFIGYTYPLMAILAAIGFVDFLKSNIQHKKIIMLLTVFLFFLGVGSNIGFYKKFAFSSTRTVSKDVLGIAENLDKINKEAKNSVVYIDRRINESGVSPLQLAPYTGINFFYNYYVSLNQDFSEKGIKLQEGYEKSRSKDEFIAFLAENNVNIDYIVTWKSEIKDYSEVCTINEYSIIKIK